MRARVCTYNRRSAEAIWPQHGLAVKSPCAPASMAVMGIHIPCSVLKQSVNCANCTTLPILQLWSLIQFITWRLMLTRMSHLWLCPGAHHEMWGLKLNVPLHMWAGTTFASNQKTDSTMMKWLWTALKPAWFSTEIQGLYHWPLQLLKWGHNVVKI